MIEVAVMVSKEVLVAVAAVVDVVVISVVDGEVMLNADITVVIVAIQVKMPTLRIVSDTAATGHASSVMNIENYFCSHSHSYV